MGGLAAQDRQRFMEEEAAKRAGDLLILRPHVIGPLLSAILEGKTGKYPIEFRPSHLPGRHFRYHFARGLRGGRIAAIRECIMRLWVLPERLPAYGQYAALRADVRN
jgi:hypothetical protein